MAAMHELILKDFVYRSGELVLEVEGRKIKQKFKTKKDLRKLMYDIKGLTYTLTIKFDEDE